MPVEDELPPATGAGSRLGFAVIVVAGKILLGTSAQMNRRLRIHCNMHFSLLNLVTIEELPETHSATICR